MEGNTMMAVSVAPGPEFTAEPPVRLFETSNVLAARRCAHTMSPTTDVFLMIRDTRPNEDDVSRQMTVVLDWFAELEARVPVN